MIIAWIGYCLVVSAFLGLAALGTERALGHYRRPVRAAWAAALAGSVILPIAAYVAPTLVARFATVTPLPEGFSSAIALPGFTSAASPSGFDWAGLLSTAGLVFGIVWAVSIAALGAHLFVSHRRLRHEMRSWTPGEILDAPVLLSPDRGPAVVGVAKGVIVIPAWVSELEESVLRLVFLHESEHLRAGDHRLFSLGLLGVVVMPWNPFAWWQLRRLRLAIEFDCDRRVMARGVDPRDYAEALLAVGSRVTALPLAAAAFAERRPAVERRLRRMTEPLRRLRGPRAAFALGVSALAVLFACNSPLPTDSALDTSASPAPDTEFTVTKVEPDAPQPSFTAYDVPPALQNRDDLPPLLDSLYPPDLKAQGVSGRVELWLHIDVEGKVAHQQLKTSSGTDAFDEAASELVQQMRFKPATNLGTVTDVWVSQWVTFGEVVDNGPFMGIPEDSSMQFAIDGTLVSREEAKRFTDTERDRIVAVYNLRGPDAIDRFGPDAGAGVIEIRTKEVAGKLTPRPDDGGEGAPDASVGPEPLFVIDGVIQAEGVGKEDLEGLEIASVEVIKGAAGESMYGPRASDGVINITTKGAAPGDPSWSPSGKRIDLANPGEEFAGAVAEAAEQSSITRRPGPPDDGARPLIVIDGVLQSTETTLSDLGTLEIDHVEIIKGAAARQLYGDRGRDGVIQIKTKGGA
jgi:TonB family protein